jgi:hypothetical protein
MKRLLLCLLLSVAMGLASCEEFEGERSERAEGQRIQLADEAQQIEVTVAQ